MKEQIYIKAALTNPVSLNALKNIVKESEVFEIADREQRIKPSVLFYELNGNPDMDFQVIHSFMKDEHIPYLFLLAEKPSSDALMRAIKAGAREVFSPTLKKGEVITALDRLKSEILLTQPTSQTTTGRIINVVGSKGGVGTTTVAVNLATTLVDQRKGSKVALLDMNTLFGEIPLFLDLHAKFHWGEITRNIDRLDESFLSNVMEKHSSGVRVLTSPAYLNGHVPPTPEIIDRMLLLMQSMFDYIIIDNGQATDETSLRILQLSDMVLLVSILSLPCLGNAKKIIQSYTNLGYASREKIHLVVNRFLKKTDISLNEAEASINKKIFCVIPNDYRATMSAINQGKSLIEMGSKSGIISSFKTMVDLVAGKNVVKGKKRKRFLFI